MKYQGWYVAQQPEEFQSWKERVAEVRPKTYLEIGSLNGGTLLMVADALAPGATIISVDTVKRPSLQRSLSKLEKRGFDVYLIVGDSTAPAVSRKIADILGSAWLEAAFIDGDHSFACVLSDYRLCRKMMQAGGLMGFHDIATVAQTDIALVHSVDVAWKWIKSEHCHHSKVYEYIVDLPAKRPAAGSVGNGIGVVVI